MIAEAQMLARFDRVRRLADGSWLAMSPPITALNMTKLPWIPPSRVDGPTMFWNRLPITLMLLPPRM